MRVSDAEDEYLARLAAAGLDATALDFWETWRVFKDFLAVQPLEDVYDAASFQCGLFPAGAGPGEAAVYLVRQFSRRLANGPDVLVGRVVTEFCYEYSRRLDIEAADVWTHDYPTLSDWASTVEGLEQFQKVQAATAAGTSVYAEWEE